MSIKAGMAVAAVLAAATLASCATGPTYESNAEAVDDATITANVKAALLQDPDTRASNISVNTIHGRVDLTGFVNSREVGDDAALLQAVGPRHRPVVAELAQLQLGVERRLPVAPAVRPQGAEAQADAGSRIVAVTFAVAQHDFHGRRPLRRRGKQCERQRQQGVRRCRFVAELK